MIQIKKYAVLYNFRNIWEIFNVVILDSSSLYDKLCLVDHSGSTLSVWAIVDYSGSALLVWAVVDHSGSGL